MGSFSRCAKRMPYQFLPLLAHLWDQFGVSNLGPAQVLAPSSSALLHFPHLFHRLTGGSQKALASPLLALGAGEAISPGVWPFPRVRAPILKAFPERGGEYLSI